MKETLMALGFLFLIGIPLAMLGGWFKGTDYYKRAQRREEARQQLGDFGVKLVIEEERRNKEKSKN